MSAILSVGFSGDSRKTIATFGWSSSAFSTAATFPMSQKTASTPNFPRPRKRLSVQP